VRLFVSLFECVMTRENVRYLRLGMILQRLVCMCVYVCVCVCVCLFVFTYPILHWFVFHLQSNLPGQMYDSVHTREHFKNRKRIYECTKKRLTSLESYTINTGEDVSSLLPSAPTLTTIINNVSNNPFISLRVTIIYVQYTYSSTSLSTVLT